MAALARPPAIKAWICCGFRDGVCARTAVINRLVKPAVRRNERNHKNAVIGDLRPLIFV
jgi:hypothetical protein